LQDIIVLSPALCDVLLTSMAGYTLFVLKVPLNMKRTNKQTWYVLWSKIVSTSQYYMMQWCC